METKKKRNYVHPLMEVVQVHDNIPVLTSSTDPSNINPLSGGRNGYDGVDDLYWD